MRTLTIILFLFLSFYAYSSINKMFNEELLNNPLQNKTQLETMFNYNEIGVFKGGSFSNTIILENGYAKSKIINSQDWVVGVENRKVIQIDIIFTKYPLKKVDWITNYHKLLSARLKELFAIDPSLNNKDIKWNLILQTNCKTATETKQYFHGIMIKYKIIKEPEIIIPKEEIVIKQTKVIITPFDTSEQNAESIPIDENFIPNYSNIRQLEKNKKKPKKKKAPLPECAKFK